MLRLAMQKLTAAWSEYLRNSACLAGFFSAGFLRTFKMLFGGWEFLKGKWTLSQMYLMVEHPRPHPGIVISLMGAALGEHLGKHRSTLVAHMIKNPPTMQGTRVWSLGPEDPLEKEMQTNPVFLPGKSQGQRSLVGYSPWACKWSHTQFNSV